MSTSTTEKLAAIKAKFDNLSPDAKKLYSLGVELEKHISRARIASIAARQQIA